MRAAKAAKEAYHQVTHSIAEQLDSFISSPNPQMVEFVVDSLVPLLSMVMNEVCYAMPKDPGAFLTIRLMERHKVPDPLLVEVREWLFKKGGRVDPNEYVMQRRPVPPDPQPVRDGDASGGGSGVQLQPQPPQSQRSADQGQSPKVKQVIHEEPKKTEEPQKPKPKKEPPKQEPQKEEEDDKPRVHIGEVQVEEDSDSSGDETNDPDKQQTMRKLRKSLGPGADLQRKSAAGPNVNGRRRRFTVNISSVSLPPPPDEECLRLMETVPLFAELSHDDRAKLVSVVKCNRYEPGEIIANCGCVSEAVHMIVEGTAKVSELKQLGSLNLGDHFGEEAVRYAGSLSQVQVAAVGGHLTTISITPEKLRSLNLKPPMKKSKGSKKARGAKKNQVENAEKTEDVGDGICNCTGRQKLDYKMTDQDKAQIQNGLSSNKVLSEVLSLSRDQYDLVCQKVHMVEIPKDDILLRKGDKGDALYVLASGMLNVDVGDSKIDIKLKPGDSFGELALLYDTPRAATISAHHDAKLWVLPRSEFKSIIRMNYTSKIDKYCETLLNIPCIQKLADESNIDMIAGVLEETSFLDSEEICVEGEDAGLLNILWQGEADILKEGKVVGTLKPGNWVGEECLTSEKPSDVTVKVTSEEAVVLVLDDASLAVVLKAMSEMKSLQAKGRNSGGSASALEMDKENFADETLQKTMNSLHGGSDKRRVADSNGTCGKYDLKKLKKIAALGEGSFGTVLLMRDDDTQENYALKGLLKDQIKAENMSASVVNERAVMILMDSDFITRLYGTWEDPTYLYLLQEPVMGGELFDVYNDNNFFGDLVKAKFYIGCVTLGLAHMHSKRVIYRDLKLENCLLDINGYVKLTDMGIAKMVVGKTYTVCGTADYFAPETLKQTGHNRAVDWWACGVLLFTMCAGRSPFDAPDVTTIYKNIIKGFSKVKMPETFPSDLIDVIKSLCRKAPEERVTMQKGGVENLKQMPYFSRLDWDDLEEKKVEAPFFPSVPSEADLGKRQLSRPMDVDVDNLKVWDSGMPSGII
eukprot:TRINITY_DN4452_c0_g1_i1.p1 TRINITY_DN4452_c0_g1~~TRINITY_DN4452_c0_g1_i1.p1  ORF type:complete len:1032 (-),score=247.81 TRINITY_DN4452_c0_g1_i1:111-3206(-)